MKKKKLRKFRSAHCSLYLLCSQEGERKNSFLFFFFSLQHFLPQHLVSQLINLLCNERSKLGLDKNSFTYSD